MDNVLSVAFCHIGTGIHIGRRQYTDMCAGVFCLCVFMVVILYLVKWLNGHVCPMGIQDETFKDTSIAVGQKQMKGL